jgi:hypothetical protein
VEHRVVGRPYGSGWKFRVPCRPGPNANQNITACLLEKEFVGVVADLAVGTPAVKATLAVVAQLPVRPSFAYRFGDRSMGIMLGWIQNRCRSLLENKAKVLPEQGSNRGLASF